MQLEKLPLDDLTPLRLWSELDADTRQLAARSIYRDRSGRVEADTAIASALRFREVAVRKMSVDERISYLLRRVPPDDSLITSLLLHLHLAERRPLLAAFLDALAVPHDNGLIDEAYEFEPLERGALDGAVAALYEGFDRTHVDLYLASLLAMDSEIWGEIAAVLHERT